jgi:hypothetical protein
MGGLGDIGAGLGGTISSIAILAGAGGKGGDEYFKKAMQVWEKLNTPEYDMHNLTAPELKIVAEMFPEKYNAVIPQDVKTAQDSPELRSAQMEGVAKLQRTVEQGGMPIEDKLAAQQTQGMMSQQAARQGENITRQMAERGMAGGGAELAAKLSAQQGSTNLAAQQGSDLVRQGALRSLQAAEALPGAAGQVRGQDINLSGQQADAINRFNEMRAQMLTAQNQYGAGAAERAQQYNVQNKQNTANTNVQAQYANQQYNQQNQNALRQQAYMDQLKKAQGLSGAYTGYGNELDMEKAAKEATIQQLGQSAGRTVGGVAGLAGGGFGF